MTRYPPERIYAAVRALLPMLDAARRQQAEALLAQAEQAPNTDVALVDLLTARDDAIAEQFRALLKGEDAERTLGSVTPPGEIVVTQPGDVYACPECDYRYRIGEVGEKPQPCQKHPHAELQRL
ncbi:MAG: hypothetical protein D6794_05510 [Deltaproteobacteria bacterium]|nr:MAG: hypothetical protein D6794_05510 [Deltaproteobacteria bacterium]